MKAGRSFPGVLFLALVVSGGCASGGGGGGAGSASSSRDLIVEADLEGLDNLSVYEAIRRLRPNWLRYRGQAVMVGPDRETLRVYLDGSYYGDADATGNLQVRNVLEIRFLDARQATLRFGTGHTVGAILVTSRRAP